MCGLRAGEWFVKLGVFVRLWMGGFCVRVWWYGRVRRLKVNVRVGVKSFVCVCVCVCVC